MAGESSRTWRRVPSTLVVVITCVVLGVIFIPRVLRCVRYQRFVSVNGVLDRLKNHPVKLILTPSSETLPVDTGYATFNLPLDWLRSAAPYKTWLALRGEDDASVVLFEPNFESTLSNDGNYSFTRDSLQSLPKSLSDVFWMSELGFRQYVLVAGPKCINSYNDRRISEFETDHVKGFIQHGSNTAPQNLMILVWSKHGLVAQGIQISMPNAEAREKTAECIAASFRFQVDGVPQRQTIIEMVNSAAETINSKTGDGVTQ